MAKKKITIGDLAGMVKRGFDDVGRRFGDAIDEIRSEMVTKGDLAQFATKEDLKRFATKEDLKHFATKEDMRELKEDIIGEVRTENAKVIQSNDKVISKLDTFLKDRAAHDSLHKHIDDKLHDHDQRLTRLEPVVKVAG